jgi:hypothetical protein
LLRGQNFYKNTNNYHNNRVKQRTKKDLVDCAFCQRFAFFCEIFSRYLFTSSKNFHDTWQKEKKMSKTIKVLYALGWILCTLPFILLECQVLETTPELEPWLYLLQACLFGSVFFVLYFYPTHTPRALCFVFSAILFSILWKWNKTFIFQIVFTLFWSAFLSSGLRYVNFGTDIVTWKKEKIIKINTNHDNHDNQQFVFFCFVLFFPF